MKIAVIDGQGGGIGRHLTERLRKELPEDVEIIALGTNSQATTQMLKAGANEGATGENAMIFNLRQVDLIVGSLGILMAHSFLGEFSPKMAEAVAVSKAKKFLLPLNRNNVELAGVKAEPLPHFIEDLVRKIKREL